MTAFVHEDVALHNPLWARWLSCLRPNASHASLSPTLRMDFTPRNLPSRLRVSKFISALGLDANRTATLGDVVPSSCCFLVVVARHVLRSFPLARYVNAAPFAMEDPFELEDVAHHRADHLHEVEHRCREERQRAQLAEPHEEDGDARDAVARLAHVRVPDLADKRRAEECDTGANDALERLE